MTNQIILGITGGIAAYKIAELVRLLKKQGVEVQVVMSEGAKQFMTPVTLQALSGRPVYSDLWDSRFASSMAHIDLPRAADGILIAPASADFIGKLANGLCDDLLSTLCMARNAQKCPLAIAPAMNREMWESAALQRNIRLLEGDGVRILGPGEGDQACGETGMGRMLDPEELASHVFRLLQPMQKPSNPLGGKKVLVTAGPTVEPIDPVRAITNRSSGKMGYAIAAALMEAGANVILVSGPCDLAPPVCVNLIRVTTASQMMDAVSANIDTVDMFFSVAAVADYTPAAPQIEKIKKSQQTLTIELAPTQDILAAVAGRASPPFCVGFAAESENVVENAVKKRQKKRIPMIVANNALTAIGSDENAVTIIDEHGEHVLGRAPKGILARQIVDHACRLFLAKA